MEVLDGAESTLRLSDPSFPAEHVTAYLDAAMRIIASAASRGARIVFGSGEARSLHHIMLEAEPLAALIVRVPLLGHAHIADTERLPPGQGDWPLAEFLDTLDRAAYRGTMSIECTRSDYASGLTASRTHLRTLS